MVKKNSLSYLTNIRLMLKSPQLVEQVFVLLPLKQEGKMFYIAVLTVALMLTLACEAGPSGPPPTPVRVSAHELSGSLTANPVLAKETFEGAKVLVSGVQRQAGERGSGYFITIESGLHEDINSILCETEELPITVRGAGVEANGTVSFDSTTNIVLEDCWYYEKINPISAYIQTRNIHPTRDEILDACSVLYEVGFSEVAEDKNLTDREADLISDAIPYSSWDFEAILGIAYAIVYFEGANSELWCSRWR